MRGDTTTLSGGERFEVLAHPERRRLLAALLTAAPDEELPVTVGRDDTAQRDIRLSMHHQHLPMLVSLGIVEQGGEPHHVRRGAAFDDLRPLLEHLETGDDELVERSA